MTTQFSDFYNSLDPDPLKRGKQFEHFVKWFLKADPEWATQVDQVWLWDEWPGRWGADCGIDLVILHKDGKHWAVQAKCYSPDYDITKHDVDKFLSESNRPSIQHRLLIATTDRIGANAKQVCDAQEKPVVRFLLSDFDKSALEYPANLSELPQAKRKPRPEPRDHQHEARAAVVQGLQTADRGQLIMACGTGKTYVTLWIKEELDAQRTLVLVPSLGLLSQLLREWTFAAATPFEVLCVCSDQTVGAKGHDEAIHSVADLAFPVTSDADEVKRFLSGAGNRVVFSTYQSSSVIAAAQADTAIPAFDLAVADEAHRCAGKVGSDFTAILDNAQIRSTKRLFATAIQHTDNRYVAFDGYAETRADVTRYAMPGIHFKCPRRAMRDGKERVALLEVNTVRVRAGLQAYGRTGIHLDDGAVFQRDGFDFAARGANLAHGVKFRREQLKSNPAQQYSGKAGK